MVGVPGRSKGCSTCRRRKKGCDKHVPSCRQCISAGLECGGYGRDLIWVNAVPQTGKAKAAYSKPGSRAQMAASPLASASGPATAPAPSSSSTRPARRARPTAISSKDQTRIALHDSLAMTAREQKYLGMFWSAYLPHGRAFSPQASTMSTGGWTGVLGRLLDSEATLRLAVLALSATMLGVQGGDVQLRIKGLQTYSWTVQELATALRVPGRATGDGLLAAVRMLEFYEVTFGSHAELPQQAERELKERKSQITGWRGHNDGQLALLLLRGPKGVQQEPAHQLFVDGRLNIVIAAITNRVSSPLSLDIWKTVPWELIPKSPKDRLIDILADVPGLLQDLDAMRNSTCPSTASDLRQGLLVRCREAARAVAIWEAGCGQRLDTYDYTIQGKQFPPLRTDSDLALLHLSNLYWAVCMLVYSTMGILMKPLPHSPDSTESQISQTATPPYMPATASLSPTPSSTSAQSPRAPPSPSPSFNPRTYACKIAWSAPLFFEPANGAFGTNIGLFPLGLASRILSLLDPLNQPCEERLLIQSLFSKPFMGTYVGSFLNSLQRDVVQPSLRQMPGVEGYRARAKMWWYDGNTTDTETSRKPLFTSPPSPP